MKNKIIPLIFIGFLLNLEMTFAQKGTVHEWLYHARISIEKGDTLKGIQEFENAVNLGLFDMSAIEQRVVLNFLLNDHRTQSLIHKIALNRKRFSDPQELIIETSDINRFWESFEFIQEDTAEEIFFNNYIQQGSLGLQTFYRVRMGQSLDRFINRIRSMESYYKSIKNLTLEFEALKPEIILSAKKLKEIYPDALFPPIYFLMGSLTNVGTPDGYAGMLIGTEHFCKEAETNLSSLSALDKMVIFEKDQAIPIIIHEYVHLQQKNQQEKTLLDYTIMEGAADFVTYLLLGKYTNPEVFEFGLTHEKELWEKFQHQMHGEDLDDWLFNVYNSETGYPANLGYFIGFRICESYYNQAKDKKQAIKEILEIQDFDRFLLASKYQLW